MAWWGYALTTVWLGLCARYDARERNVPNGLTIPPLLPALYVAYRRGRLDIMFAVFVAVYAAFLLRTLGPADGKIAVALAGLWPRALVGGAVVLGLWFLALRLRGEGRKAVPGAVGLFGGTLVTLTLGVLGVYNGG